MEEAIPHLINTLTPSQWLNTYKDLLLISLKEAKTKSLQHVRPITNYFGAA
jgi:hypothetical protein